MCERDRGREKVLSELSVLARKPGLVRACPFVLHTAVSTLDGQKHSHTTCERCCVDLLSSWPFMQAVCKSLNSNSPLCWKDADASLLSVAVLEYRLVQPSDQFDTKFSDFFGSPEGAQISGLFDSLVSITGKLATK